MRQKGEKNEDKIEFHARPTILHRMHILLISIWFKRCICFRTPRKDPVSPLRQTEPERGRQSMSRIGRKYNETMSAGGNKTGKLEGDFRCPAGLQTRYPRPVQGNRGRKTLPLTCAAAGCRLALFLMLHQ